MIKLSQISGNIVDLVQNRIYGGTIVIENGRISEIYEDNDTYESFIIAGFVDAHVHIESSMLTPYEFARMASLHGTVATISDPHEIANVLGLEGIEFMIKNAEAAPLKCHFGAPPCVPATTFETAGNTITADDIEYLFKKYPNIKYLSEVMNFPGVLAKDPDMMAKIALAKKYKKKIDGHAPNLRGAAAKQYIEEGISTDHECFTLEEALDKLMYGMKIIIREGSAAKNYEALIPLLETYSDRLMFCSDDKHPNDLAVGHINELVKRSVKRGLNVMEVLRVASLNPIKHYGLDVGLLQVGDAADMVVVNNLTDFEVESTYINGYLVAQEKTSMLEYRSCELLNNFETSKKTLKDFEIKATAENIKVIEALDGQLITNALEMKVKTDSSGNAISDTENDVLKLAVVNRYEDAEVALAFIKNFGLKRGAIASSVAHDSHNIIAVGATDTDILRAVNLLIEAKGGLVAVDGEKEAVLPLPLAGIMTNENAWTVARQYTELDRMAKALGSPLHSPYMTLSFMALLVIPNLKLSDKGLFDGEKFQFTDVFVKGNV
ncbi:MAG: adenine deaminase [Chitinophagales bacterium]